MVPTKTTDDAGRVEVRDLCKSFGAVRAVDRLTFTVGPGGVTGFLGPNGAGKTTTLRMLLGLVTPDSGAATIGGRSYRTLPVPNSTVGAALEATGFHPARSGRSHLRVYCTVNRYPVKRADEVLDLVGLTDAANRSVRGYSLGMRQRLALAAALLGDPQVLILDEPGNGLDPEGIAWLRRMLRDLAVAGRTVLVSSHVLSEVQQLVDRVVIIHNGRCVREGSLADLVDLDGPVVAVRTSKLDDLRTALLRSGIPDARIGRTGPGNPIADPTGPCTVEGDLIPLVAGEFRKLISTRLWLWLLLAALGVTALYATLDIAFANTPGTFTLPLTTPQGQRTYCPSEPVVPPSRRC